MSPIPPSQNQTERNYVTESIVTLVRLLNYPERLLPTSDPFGGNPTSGFYQPVVNACHEGHCPTLLMAAGNLIFLFALLVMYLSRRNAVLVGYIVIGTVLVMANYQLAKNMPDVEEKCSGVPCSERFED
ncbi:hypothetical protein GGR52DRAFT_543102 [Hypoxylon sp. FL1284]|nr:hypothetical protein GGR52DRAFT_543102 [Hypoxylon sp. FL1284]